MRETSSDAEDEEFRVMKKGSRRQKAATNRLISYLRTYVSELYIRIYLKINRYVG